MVMPPCGVTFTDSLSNQAFLLQKIYNGLVVAFEEPSMYLLHINDQGKIGLFQLHGNGTFTLDNLDEYQKLVKWNQQNMRAPLNLDLPCPPKSKIFFDSLPLVQVCKNAELMLHAKEGGFTLGGIDARDAAPRLIRLNFAWTRLRDSRERKTASGLVRHESNLLVPEPAWNGLNVTLKEESSEVRRISSLTITRPFIYIDISHLSNYKPGDQALIINSLAGAVNAPDLWQTRRNVGIEAMLCIGDGYIFVFSSPITGTFFAAYLAQLIEIMVANRDLPVDFHFRIGVHAGPVYTFWDPGRAGGWNYIGEVINGGS